jgi:hypothetical protein
MGKNIDIREYTITNILGQITQNEKTENKVTIGQIKVSFNSNISNGQNILTLKDNQNNYSCKRKNKTFQIIFIFT